MKVLNQCILRGHHFTFALPTLSDKNLLVEGFKKLSSRSKHYRFHASKASLSTKEVDFFLDVDAYDHFAIGVIEKIKEKVHGIALIRYIRDTSDLSTAEVALAIVDSHHRLGLGCTLYTELIEHAKSNNIKTFTHYILNENRAMLNLLKKFDATFSNGLSGTTKVTVLL